MVSRDWDDTLARFSPKWRKFLLEREASAYEAIIGKVPKDSQEDISRYTVILALAGVFLFHRPEMLKEFDQKGIGYAAIGLDQRSTSYRNLASTFEGLRVPQEVAQSNHLLVRALRDHAAIDRRSAAELRVRGDVESYRSGEKETKSVCKTISNLVAGMTLTLRVYFRRGEFDRLFVRRIADGTDSLNEVPDIYPRDSRINRES